MIKILAGISYDFNIKLYLTLSKVWLHHLR